MTMTTTMSTIPMNRIRHQISIPFRQWKEFSLSCCFIKTSGKHLANKQRLNNLSQLIDIAVIIALPSAAANHKGVCPWILVGYWLSPKVRQGLYRGRLVDILHRVLDIQYMNVSILNSKGVGTSDSARISQIRGTGNQGNREPASVQKLGEPGGIGNRLFFISCRPWNSEYPPQIMKLLSIPTIQNDQYSTNLVILTITKLR